MRYEEPDRQQHHEFYDCPHCGKTSLIRQRNRYRCIYCSFQRDVSEAGWEDTSTIVQFAGIFFASLLVLVIASESETVPEAASAQAITAATVGKPMTLPASPGTSANP